MCKKRIWFMYICLSTCLLYFNDLIPDSIVTVPILFFFKTTPEFNIAFYCLRKDFYVNKVNRTLNKAQCICFFIEINVIVFGMPLEKQDKDTDISINTQSFFYISKYLQLLL